MTKFRKNEREVTWSLLQCMRASLDVPYNTIVVDTYILIQKYLRLFRQNLNDQNQFNYRPDPNDCFNSNCLNRNIYFSYNDINTVNSNYQNTPNSTINSTTNFNGNVNKPQYYDNSNVINNRMNNENDLYKIIISAFFLALKMNNMFRSLDRIFTSLVRCVNQLQEIFGNDSEISIKCFIGLENYTQGDLNFFSDALKNELISKYELDILRSNNFLSHVEQNPFKTFKRLSKRFKWGSFSQCEKITYFVCKIIKNPRILDLPPEIVAAASTAASYADTETPKCVYDWIESKKNENFYAFDTAIAICCK
ncbi:hypothetical protein TRFO_36328 [Tritrichomonas foetus]|uniref:Uncharacterized protein n=1 Tax=Tritrichomonas foetus TaxID=1144522 RepID=A0A1J4JE83_9EUKA|nr:hypothetical protein TRFO_36328 [Tritrichomonas foetus]|eukprot:OHS97466.1 hypothetical protein TRFO_36328 [Tritrichomonas foetus]